MKHVAKTRQRARWVPEMDSERRGLQTLLAFAYGMQLGRSRRIAQELHRLAQQAQLASDATGAAIAVSSGDSVECIARIGELAPQLGSRPDAGLSHECIRTGISQVCADTETDQVIDRTRSRTSGVRSVVYVPIFRGSQPAGVIGVFSDKPGHFTEHDLRILNLIGREVTKLLKWEPKELPQFPATPPKISAAVLPEKSQSLDEKPTSSQHPSGVKDSAPDTRANHVSSSSEAFRTLSQTNPPESQVAPANLEFATLDSYGEGRFRRWMTLSLMIAACMTVGAGAAWLLLSSPKQDPYPMVYGPPQVTTDSPSPILQQDLEAPDASASSNAAATTAPLAPAAKIAPRLEAVRMQTVGDHTFVSLYMTAGAVFKTHALKDPNRIYVDFEGTGVAPQMKTANFEPAGPVAEFRFAKSASKTRVVMVLSNPCTYLVTVTSNPHVVVFDLQPRRP